MLWPHSWSLSALCPPCVRLVPAMCPLRPCLQTLSATRVPCVRLEFASCPLWMRFQTLSAMCLPCPQCVHCVTTMCPPCVLSSLGLGLPFGFCPFLACYGQGRGIIKPNSFLPLHKPTAFILHARWSVSLALILVPQIRPLQTHPMLENQFGV